MASAEKVSFIRKTGSSLYFPHVNLLRAFAALSVLVYHVIEFLLWKSFPVRPFIFLWFRTGWMGVDLFFVISGFVIMLSMLRLQRKHGNANFVRRVFIRRRLARIVPLYLVTGLAFILFVRPDMISTTSFFYHLLTHIGFVHNWFLDTHGSINGPNWSVATEMQFYGFVVIFIVVLTRTSPRMLLATGILTAIVSRLGVFLIAETRGWEVCPRFVYSTQVIPMLDEFTMGMFIAKLVMSPQNGHIRPLLIFKNRLTSG